MAEKLNTASHERYLDLLNTEDFTPWFSTVTPLTEVGLLPIGSRPAKRGLGAKSLDDLRTIPWIFSWSQARINLAAWYGLGTACEQLGDLDQLKAAYQEWPFFRTFIDNIEMSIAKTDQRIAKMYLHLATAMICPRRSSPRCSSRVSGSLPSSVMSGRCSVVACSAAPFACVTPTSTLCPSPRSAPFARCA